MDVGCCLLVLGLHCLDHSCRRLGLVVLCKSLPRVLRPSSFTDPQPRLLYPFTRRGWHTRPSPVLVRALWEVAPCLPKVPPAARKASVNKRWKREAARRCNIDDLHTIYTYTDMICLETGSVNAPRSDRDNYKHFFTTHGQPNKRNLDGD
jgi:hypothetical protein